MNIDIVILLFIMSVLLFAVLLILSCRSMILKSAGRHQRRPRRRICCVDKSAPPASDESFITERADETRITDAFWAETEEFGFAHHDIESLAERLSVSGGCTVLLCSADVRVFFDTASALSHRGSKVLLVELDDKARPLSQLFNIKKGRISPRRGFYPTHFKKLFVAPYFSIGHVQRSFELLREVFDIILVCRSSRDTELPEFLHSRIETHITAE